MWHDFKLLVVEPNLGGRIVMRNFLEYLDCSIDFGWDEESTTFQTQWSQYDFILFNESYNSEIPTDYWHEFRNKSTLNISTPLIRLGKAEKITTVNSIYYYFEKPKTLDEVFKLMDFLVDIKRGLLTLH